MGDNRVPFALKTCRKCRVKIGIWAVIIPCATSIWRYQGMPQDRPHLSISISNVLQLNLRHTLDYTHVIYTQTRWQYANSSPEKPLPLLHSSILPTTTPPPSLSHSKKYESSQEHPLSCTYGYLASLLIASTNMLPSALQPS